MTPAPSLTALVVTVRPTQSVVLPAHLGRAVQALFFRWLSSCDAALAQRWHDADGVKPYTCSGLVGGRRMGPDMRAYDPEMTCWFRLTGLNAEISAALQTLATQPPRDAELDGAGFAVETAVFETGAHPWAGATDYETLAAPFLMARSRSPRRVRIELVTSTTFRSQERNMPLPLPELVFGSLCDRWNAFSPVALSSEVRAYCASSVGISRFELRSTALPSIENSLQIGSLGEITFNALRYDRYWMAVLGLLSAYAFYAGVGRGTTAGFGQAREID